MAVTRRWLLGLAAVLVLLASASVAVPALWVDDGVAAWSGQARAAAEDALLMARIACGSEPGDRVLRRWMRVVDVELAPGGTGVGGAPAYRALVRSYTLFAVPTGTVRVRPGSAHCLGLEPTAARGRSP